MNELLTALEDPFISALSIFVSESLEEQNNENLDEIVRNISQKFGQTVSVVIKCPSSSERGDD